MSDYPEITEDKIKTLLAESCHGLPAGMGKPEPGKMCVEHLTNSVLYGINNDEEPQCVDRCIRTAMFRLNDSPVWRSNYSRARGLRRPMIAQLGSAGIDEKKFLHLYAIKTVSVILGDLCEERGEHDLSEKCRAAKTLEEARDAADAVIAAAVTRVLDAIAAADVTPAFAATAADAAVRAAEVTDDESYLIKSGEIITQICIELGTVGSKYLHLVDSMDKEQGQ